MVCSRPWNRQIFTLCSEVDLIISLLVHRPGIRVLPEGVKPCLDQVEATGHYEYLLFNSLVDA